MERTFFSGNTLEQAVLAAARHHGLDPDRVAYKLRDKKHGFLNIRRRVVIEVDPAAPERDLHHAEDRKEPTSNRGGQVDEPLESRGGGNHRFPGESGRDGKVRRERAAWRGVEPSWVASEPGGQELEAVEVAIEQVADLAGTELTSSVRREDRSFEIELSGPGSRALLEDRGSGLDAIEHLLPRLVRGLTGHGVPCRVNSDGFREAREEELKRLARGTAEEVIGEGVERRLELMNPADRRQIHMALVDEPGVRTESEGEGFLKRVRVLPA